MNSPVDESLPASVRLTAAFGRARRTPFSVKLSVVSFLLFSLTVAQVPPLIAGWTKINTVPSKIRPTVRLLMIAIVASYAVLTGMLVVTLFSKNWVYPWWVLFPILFNEICLIFMVGTVFKKSRYVRNMAGMSLAFNTFWSAWLSLEAYETSGFFEK